MKQQLSCTLPAMSSKHWLPDHDPEPATEVLSGDLYLLTTSNVTCRGRGARYPVHVHIYRSCFGHYAVISASLRAPATFLNLRTCNARACLSGAESSDTRLRRFRVEMGGGEGQVIYFEVRDDVGVERWVRAFQGNPVPSPGNISPSLSPVIPRNPIMPTLQESIEEEEEEEEMS